MKIIHTADIHLGSKLKSKFPSDITKKRKEEVLDTFDRLIDYANKNSISLILLSGDIFDGVSPTRKDKEYFYNIIKNNPDITFMYLKGNHDIDTSNDETFDNLKTFSDVWSSYEFDNIVISGLEISSSNEVSMYSTLSLEQDKTNIVMLHENVGSSKGNINILKLKNKNIDYLALGHIHEYKQDKIDDRGVYVYSGCLEPRGFDDIGVKGFVEIDITNNKITHKFIPFAARNILKKDVDITTMKDVYQIKNHIKNDVIENTNDIYRIILKGESELDSSEIVEQLKESLKTSCFFIDFKDEVKEVFDINKYTSDLSLKGEFVRLVYNNDDYSEDEKIKIIRLGLNVIDKKGVE